MVATYAERVATRAATFKPLRALLIVLASPFYLIGLLVGLLWILVSWAYAAVLVGVEDGRRRGDT